MKNAFLLNPNLNKLELIDAINERLMKSKSLTSSILACDFNGDSTTKAMYGFIWVLNDYLEELDVLFDKLEKIDSNVGCG